MEDVRERLTCSFLSFENRPVKIIALRELPGLRLEGFTVGPYEEKREYEERLWVAERLEREGYVSVKPGERLDLNQLSKIHFTESLQPAKQLSSLPEGFYPKMRRYLSQLKARTREDPRELPRYERSERLAAEIVERRLRRIVTMASGPAVTSDVLRPLTEEERVLYESLRSTIEQWRSSVLEFEERRPPL
ncbi:MAG: hypothetical protein QW057_04095 [Candidatus Bathyarchaeia archaeon]